MLGVKHLKEPRRKVFPQMGFISDKREIIRSKMKMKSLNRLENPSWNQFTELKSIKNVQRLEKTYFYQ